jgi:hypothetical protein
MIAQNGMRDVTDAISCRSYELGPSSRLTFIVSGHDSIIVRGQGTVVVNVNFALHSSEPYATDVFSGYVKQRWPRMP